MSSTPALADDSAKVLVALYSTVLTLAGAMSHPVSDKSETNSVSQEDTWKVQLNSCRKLAEDLEVYCRKRWTEHTVGAFAEMNAKASQVNQTLKASIRQIQEKNDKCIDVKEFAPGCLYAGKMSECLHTLESFRKKAEDLTREDSIALGQKTKPTDPLEPTSKDFSKPAHASAWKF